jgi:hypothetical protein
MTANGRHRCEWCNREFFPCSSHRSKNVEAIDPDARFCTLRCAARYAVCAVERLDREIDAIASQEPKT